MNKSFLFSLLLTLCVVSCGESKKTLLPEAALIINSLDRSAAKVPEKIADEATVTNRRFMLGELLTDSDFESDTLVIVENFANEPANVYTVDIFNTKKNAIVSYLSEQKRTSGRKKNIINGEYEMLASETSDETVQLVQSVAKNGINIVDEGKSKLSMFKSLKSASTIVSLLIKDGDSYKIESKEK